MGGYDGNGFSSEATTSVDLIGDVTCVLPQLPINIPYQPSIILTNDNQILACGGYPNNMHECLVLKDQNWIKHSDLIEKRYDSSAVTMAKGVYILGGDNSFSQTTSEFLPTGSTNWHVGPNIPEGFTKGCAVKVSDFELILIGGYKTRNRIIKLNVNTKEWTNLGELKEGRYAHSCAVMSGKIIVSGGKTSNEMILKSTEIISLDNPTASRIVGSLNEERGYPGLAVSHINNQPTLLAIGGEFYQNGTKYRNSIETWNSNSESWTLSSDLKLDRKKYHFGFLSILSSLLCH